MLKMTNTIRPLPKHVYVEAKLPKGGGGKFAQELHCLVLYKEGSWKRDKFAHRFNLDACYIYPVGGTYLTLIAYMNENDE